MTAALTPHIALVRLYAEKALVRRLNHGYGFADSRIPAEVYLRDPAARERLTRDSMRPQLTHEDQARELEAAIADARAALDGHASPLTVAGDRFRLDAAERAVLAIAAAYELDADVRGLCHALAGPRHAALYADVCQELAPELAPTAALLRALHPAGNLRRGCLLDAGDDAARIALGARVGCQLAIARNALDWLVGDDRVAAPLDAALALVPPERDPGVVLSQAVTAQLESVVARVRAWSASAPPAARGADEPPLIVIQGPPGVGKSAVAHALARALGRPLAVAPLPRLLALQARAGDPLLVRRALCEARLRGAVPYLPGIEALAGRGGPAHAGDDGTGSAAAANAATDAAADAAADAIRAFDDAIVVATGDRGVPSVPVRRAYQVIRVPPPDLALRRAAWERGLAWLGDAADLPAGAGARLAARYVIGPGTIREVVSDARSFARATGGRVATDTVEQAVGRRLTMRLGSFGTLITRRARLEDMVLPGDVRESIRDMIAMVRERSRILEEWGYAEHLGLSRGVSALFSGDPGTGKTMAASVISGALGLELVRIDLSAVVSKWVGETEKHLARIFDEAQTASAMLLFDEADSLFGKRTELKSAQDRYANLEVNYVLQRMETFDGVSILTTNMESSIDPAFLRRLNFRVRFPAPEADERAELWRRLIPPGAGLGDVDVDRLARRFVMTGGHIRNAIVRAAVVAARQGRAMTAHDLVAGAHHEYAELGKVMTSLVD